MVVSQKTASVLGCPATFLVVPGARTTEVSKAVNMLFFNTNRCGLWTSQVGVKVLMLTLQFFQ